MNKKNIYCIFGIDGAGKTTTIANIKKRLEKRGQSCKVLYMGRGDKNNFKFMNLAVKLNNLYWAKKKRRQEKNPGKKFAMDMYRRRSLPFLIMYYIELWSRYLEAKKLSKNNIVLLDRFFYDALILTHNKYGFFRFFTPKVKSFFLYLPYEIARKRKKEATRDGIKKYRSETKKLMKYFDITEIDSSKPLKEVLKNVEAHIENG